MKRPQFGLRLMLLVVALLATIFAWRNAANIKRRFDFENSTKVQILQNALEWWTKDRNQMLKNGETPSPEFDARLKRIQTELSSLRP